MDSDICGHFLRPQRIISEVCLLESESLASPKDQVSINLADGLRWYSWPLELLLQEEMFKHQMVRERLMETRESPCKDQFRTPHIEEKSRDSIVWKSETEVRRWLTTPKEASLRKYFITGTCKLKNSQVFIYWVFQLLTSHGVLKQSSFNLGIISIPCINEQLRTILQRETGSMFCWFYNREWFPLATNEWKKIVD